jgi:hypothetical protein
MDLEELYKSYSAGGVGRELLAQSDWFASFAEFDPKTGDALPMSLNELLRRIASREPRPYVKDRFWLLTEHSREAAMRLMKSLSEEPRREHAFLHIRDVKELDTTSFIALSRRPGRNIREKLANKPYMQAVRHFQSIDVTENRLLKSYLTQLSEALELRRNYLDDETVSEYLQAIHRWLNDDEIQRISRWENTAPNNALISHRDYRRIWNSWRMLQVLADDIDRDLQHIQERRVTKTRWELLGKRYAQGQNAFADMPVLVDYNLFSIRPWDDALPTTKATGSRMREEWFETNEPVCIDLTQPQPVFATPQVRGKLKDSFFWQHWHSEEASVDIELFESDAIYLHQDATTVSDSDMFFSKGEGKEALGYAARSFAQRLKKHFHNARLIWLMPDSLSEFDLEVVRRNLNAAFSYAEPLPCSVAAVFKHIRYEQIDHDDYRVGVVERINGAAYITEMVARFNGDLLESLPETHGFIWEKGVSEILSSNVEIETIRGKIPLLLRDGSWTLDCNPYGVSHSTDSDVVMPQEGYDCVIWLNGRPVEGGIRLFELQRKTPDTLLWRNHIPELMTKVLMDGYYQSFYFVGEGTTVQPVRGKAIPIPVPQEFTLPKGQLSYRLPLLQGSNEEALEYEAMLASKDFPYDCDVKCRCRMTYTYGADEPYHLIFVPIDRSLKPINVFWRLKTEESRASVEGPGYPAPITWRDLQHQYNPKSGKESDFLEWCESALKKLVGDLQMENYEPFEGIICTDWKVNKKGNRFIFARTKDGKEHYIHENALLGQGGWQKVSVGDSVYFYTRARNGREITEYVSLSAHETRRALVSGICDLIHRQLYITFISIWADGRSISDSDCPPSFASNAKQYSGQLYRHMKLTESYPIRQELRFLLCCMGKDAPLEFGSLLEVESRTSISDEKAMGFAIGDLSTEWQRAIMRRIVRDNSPHALRTIAHAAWRSVSVVDSLQSDDVERLSKRLSSILKSSLEELRKSHGAREAANPRDVTKYLELLFALLRTRNSSDEQTRTVLQPYQEMTRDLVSVTDSIIELSVSRNLQYKSRVVLDVSSKPSDDRTPDLLYALRVYLTGDSTANLIRITGIVDDE